MNSNKLRMTAQIPSYFGMPTCGYAFGTTAATDWADVRGTAVAHSFPGTSAWRPPTC